MKFLLTMIVTMLVWGSTLAEGPFLDDPVVAFRQARDGGRPVLLDFHTTWCEACGRMARTTWPDGQVVDLLQQFVAVSVDGERSPNLVDRYRVEAYPTIVIAEPEGAPVLILMGFQGPEAMRAHLSAVIADWDSLRGWAVEVANRRADPEALVELADFSRGRAAFFWAERCYRKALRSAASESALSSRARRGLAEVLAATSRSKEARKLLDKDDLAGAGNLLD
jgi:thioredoxin-like negative regulator of GroEL